MRSLMPAVVIAISLFGCAGGGVQPGAPEAKREPVVDTYAFIFDQLGIEAQERNEP